MENGKFYDGKGLEYLLPKGLPAHVNPEDDQIIQIVNGELSAVDVAESAVADYMEEYIGSALEGDY